MRTSSLLPTGITDALGEDGKLRAGARGALAASHGPLPKLRAGSDPPDAIQAGAEPTQARTAKGAGSQRRLRGGASGRAETATNAPADAYDRARADDELSYSIR